VLDDRRALAKHLTHLGIRDQVDVALAVADLHVLQAVPLLRERANRLGEDAQILGDERPLAGLGDDRRADRADVVAALHRAPEGEGPLAEDVLPHPHLDLAGAIAHLGEGGLAEAAQRDDAPRHREARRGRLVGERVRGRRAPCGEPGVDLRGGMGGREPVRVRVLAGRPQLGDLAFAFGNQIAFIGHRAPCLHFLSTGDHPGEGGNQNVFSHLSTRNQGSPSSSSSSGDCGLADGSPASTSSMATMKGSRSPSSTASTLPTLRPVRWSETSRYGAST